MEHPQLPEAKIVPLKNRLKREVGGPQTLLPSFHPRNQPLSAGLDVSEDEEGVPYAQRFVREDLEQLLQTYHLLPGKWALHPDVV